MKITRTITTYTYSFGVYDLGTGTVNDIFKEVRTERLGPRLLAKRLEELNKDGGTIWISLGFNEDTSRYVMDLERFLEYAERVDKDDV